MSVQEVRQVYRAFGTVKVSQTDHACWAWGSASPLQYTDLPDHCGITEFSITMNGDEPDLAFVMVEGTSQESVVSRWQRIATAVANTEWWS